MKPGAAFGDFIVLEKSQKRNVKNYGFDKKMRDLLLPLSILLLFGLLTIKLFHLQIIKGSYYQLLSDKNRTKITILYAPRGIIFDRSGKPLVFNVPGFRFTEKDKTVVLTKDEAINLLAKGKKDLEIDSLREYPYQAQTTHVLGYIGRINKEELLNFKDLDYQADDLIGKAGIEKEYETLLKGSNGKQLVEVNSLGEKIRLLGQTDPTPGQNLYLTLDVKIQQAVFSAMKDVKKGAAVVSTPKGEILALVSKPSFDANLFTLGESYKATDSSYPSISSILSDLENQPFLNRAIGGVYPPGSTFKLITAAAGLEDKIIDENYSIEDTGVINIGNFSFSNWYFTQYGGKDGLVDVVKAIKRSNDIFFYKLGEKIGVTKLSDFAKKFGLGEKTGIDLSGETKGLVPDSVWKEKAVGEPWYLGDTYHYGIGQGYLLTTPIQVNLWTQAIANHGDLYKPHLLKRSKINPSTKLRASDQRSKIISEKTFSLVREGMIESCSTGGVAWPLFEFKVKNEKLKVDGKNFTEVPQATTSANFQDYRKVSIACKTGTAQHGDEKTMPHAWITLFAPAYNPEIIITVLAESSGEGSNIAAPIAKKILEAYFGENHD